MSLKDKVVLITGGSLGIGYYTALQFAGEGAKVAICARNETRLQEAVQNIQHETGQEVLGMTADVSKRDECFRIVNQTAGHFGRLNILINNAGTSAANPFESVTDDLWRYDFDLKLFAALHCSKASIPHMRKEGGGSIVNVTAVIGKAPPSSSLPTSVSRAAGLALTKAMSRDLARYQIRVNTVCIGLIRSNQIEQRWKREAGDLSWEQYSKDKRHNIPLGRIGEPQEAANVVTFLASDAASYVTGTSVNIDGGKSVVL